MYAYRNNVNEAFGNCYGYDINNHNMPVSFPKVQRKIFAKKKKQRSIASSLTILAIIFIFTTLVMPFSLKNVQNLFFKRALPGTTVTETQIVNNNYFVNNLVSIQNLLFPTLNYVSNDLFFNQRLLAGSVNAKKNAVNMYESDELVDLENQLKGLNKAFPTIKPAVYVWSFETGKYAEINKDKIYPAASIIKIPVLVQLFKSIEANQISIYDEMVLSYPFRASGSGDIQYASEGNKYSLDHLAKVMIQNSDNSATNMIMSKIGGIDDINNAIKSWGVKNTYINTWLPDLTGNNTTTAYDIAKILYNLENTSFLNVNSREDIVKYMSHVKNNRLIQAGIPQGVPFVHKTGDIGKMLGDAGIVYLPNGQHYIVVILAHRPHNSPDGVNYIKAASSLIYSKMSNLN